MQPAHAVPSGMSEADAETVFGYLGGIVPIEAAVRALARLDSGQHLHFGMDDPAVEESPESKVVHDRIVSLLAQLDAHRASGVRAD